MSHITKINGTNHNINSGKVLRSGTAYKISSGKTLTGGTNKSISFESIEDTYWQWNHWVQGTPITWNLKVIPYVANTTIYNGGDGGNLVCPFSTSVTIPITGENTDYHEYVASYNCLINGQFKPDYASHFAWDSDRLRWTIITEYAYGATQSSLDITRFHVIDGSDATNSELINLLKNNATQCNSSWNPL